MSTRTEHDTFGPIAVLSDKLWGAQTQRSLQNFAISTERMPMELVVSLGIVKKAAANVNVRSSVLEKAKGEAISEAADELVTGKLDDQFPLSVWQTGSGTQTNMNVNEVLANRASEIMGGSRGSDRLVHPNDDCNKGQSSNDVFPTGMSVAAVRVLRRDLLPSVERLRDTLEERAQKFKSVVKIGRTHLQDATPLTLGQEFSGYVSQLNHSLKHIEDTLPHLEELALGGTAVGTGLNTKKGYAEEVAKEISSLTGYSFRTAPNKFEALAANDAIVTSHGALRTLAGALFKIANDIRWLSSGPRAGLAEIRIPENEPGSSIMPGKVNPTQCEAMTMLCTQVMGNDATMSFAGASGNFELNVYKPVMIYNFLQSVRLLTEGCNSFQTKCAVGIEPNSKRIEENLQKSLMLVTSLNPHIGYEKAAEIAKKAYKEESTLKEAAKALGYVEEDDFDRWVIPDNMIGPKD